MSFFLIVILFCLEAFTSDNGYAAKLTTASLRIFCETKISQDLDPIVKKMRQLMVSKMSQEALKKEHQKMDRIWKDIFNKHEKYLASLELGVLPPTKSLSLMQDTWLKIASRIEKECPQDNLNSTGQFDWLNLEEFWVRYSKVLPTSLHKALSQKR